MHFRLVEVGAKGESQKGVVYEVNLLKNDRTSRKVWGFGVNKIMEDPEPIDLSQMRSLLGEASNLWFFYFSWFF